MSLVALAAVLAAGEEGVLRWPSSTSQAAHDGRSGLLEPLPPVRAEPAVSRFALDELVEMAFQNNPTLRAAAARIRAAQGKEVQAGLYPNPVIGYHGMEMGNAGTAGQQGGFVAQRFITGGKLRLDRAIAGKEVDESHFLFHAQEQRVLSDVRVRFYDALVAQQRVELTGELARIGDGLVEATEQLLAGRQGTENDLLQAQIEAEDAHILWDNARNENLEAWRRLAAVIGVPDMAPSSLTGRLDADLPEYDWHECYQYVLEGNPELAAARTRVERMRLAVTRARRENVPNIDLSVGIRYVNPSASDTASVEAGFPLRIFDRNQGNIMRARFDVVAACAEIERIELALQDQLAVAYRRYRNAQQQTHRYRTSILPRAKRSLDLVTKGYETGQVEYLMLLTTQRTYYQVNLSYLTSLRELRASTSLIEGQLLDESLATKAYSTE